MKDQSTSFGCLVKQAFNLNLQRRFAFLNGFILNGITFIFNF